MNDSIICENCGAKCSSADAYCKKCSQPLASAREASRSAIGGIDNEQLKTFVDKNVNYYVEKFMKSRGKKVFLQINWSALLFGPTWFFYRKMYKFAIWYAAILLIFSALLTVSLPLLYREDVETFFECKEAYQAFHASDEESHFFYKDENGITQMEVNPVYEEIRDNLSAVQVKIRWLYAGVSIPPILLNIISRLFANCVYKQYIIRNIDIKEGGTSKKSAIIGWLCVWVASALVGMLIGNITAVSRFVDAYNTLYEHL